MTVTKVSWPAHIMTSNEGQYSRAMVGQVKISLPRISNIIICKEHYSLLVFSSRCKKIRLQHLSVVHFRCSPILRDLLICFKISPNLISSRLSPTLKYCRCARENGALSVYSIVVPLTYCGLGESRSFSTLLFLLL